MASLPSRLLYLCAFAGAVAVALRPSGAVEHALALALSPLRLASEVAAPIGLLRGRSVRAAERRAQALRAEEDLDRIALGADQRRFVLPQDEALRAGRSFAVAEVRRRVPGDADRLEVRLLDGAHGAARPEPGQPVVVGDHYIGRVRSVDQSGAIAVVELVTRPDVLVGARGVASGARFVVGGLLDDPGARGRAAALLAVHGASSPDLAPEPVVVDESLAGDVPFAAEAAGFAVGVLVPREGRLREAVCGVRSPIDLASGVFQMALVGRAGAGADALAAGEADALDDGRWANARALSRGDPVPGREGLKLSAGSARGVRAGAAVVSGARLVGCVERAGTHSADARLLGDPGLALPVVARIEGRERPEILGTLVALGRARAGADGRARVRFFWQGRGESAREPASDAARLFTGAGAVGVPPGLILGDTSLPRGGGPALLEVTLEVDPRELAHLRVRVAEDAPAEAAP
jgi:hypothetical protein